MQSTRCCDLSSEENFRQAGTKIKRGPRRNLNLTDGERGVVVSGARDFDLVANAGGPTLLGTNFRQLIGDNIELELF